MILNRRQFIVASSSAVLAGCHDAPPPPPVVPQPMLSDEDRERIERELQVRRKFVAALEPFRVGVGETRTTPPAPAEILQTIPLLKTQLKPAIRLHPRFGEEPPPDASKLGGQFLWPADEKWPTDPATLIPLAAVLQLREQDRTVKQFAFRPGCDVLQLLWTPRDPVAGELHAIAVWRRANPLYGQKLIDMPAAEFAFPSYVPIPCRLHPEWVGELPDWETLNRTDLRAALSDWRPPEEKIEPNVYFARYLSSSRGTKLGGWPRAALQAPKCKVCQRYMEYMLTIDSCEWSPDDAARWRPVQDQDDELGRRAACGLSFSGGSAVEIYVCRRCDDWPIRAMVVK